MINYRDELIELVADIRNALIIEHAICLHDKPEICKQNREKINNRLLETDKKLQDG
jgi:hypothetical protein